MTVAELIALLEDFEPDTRVRISYDNDSGFGDVVAVYADDSKEPAVCMISDSKE